MSESQQNPRAASWLPNAWFINAGRYALSLALAGLILGTSGVPPALGQPPEPPPKPLRERLLERARKGEAAAQFDLAKNYEGGRIGLPQDLSQAEHWYREAANQKEPFAEACLGIMYNVGKGVPRDYVLAYMWLDRSSSHLAGADRDTVVEMRDSVARKLTPSQREEAQKMANQPDADSKKVPSKP